MGKEKLLVSACLLGVNCKYSGGNNGCEAVKALAERYELVPVCPEQLGGLTTPRVPSEIAGEHVLSREGRDVTEAFRRGACEALRIARFFGCRKAVLKQASPSCGTGTVYDGSFSGVLTEGDGVTAALLRASGIGLYSENETEQL